MNMKVLLFAHVDPPIHGQAAAAALLVEQGRAWEQVDLYHINTVFTEKRSNLAAFSFAKVARAFKYIGQAVAEIRRRDIDAVLLTPSFLPGSLLKDVCVIIALRVFTRKTIVGWVHMDPNRLDHSSRIWLYRTFVDLGLSRVDRWVACSPRLVSSWPSFIPAHKCCGIVNGIRPPPPATRPRARALWRVVYLSAMDDQKGWRDLLAVAVGLCSAWPDVEFLFYGGASGGNLERDILAAFEEAGRPDRITWRGPVEGMEKWQAFADADLFCLPSHTEQFPLTILEAMASGLPIVAADVGAIGDALQPEKGGWLVPAGDRRALEAAIDEATADRRRCRTMGDYNRNVYEARFTDATFGAAWEGFLQSLSKAPDAAAAPPARLRVAVYLADQNPARDRSLGISSMTRTLLRSLAESDRIEPILFTSSSSLGADGFNGMRRVRLPLPTNARPLRVLIDNLHRALLPPPGSDIWFYPKGYLPWLVSRARPTVATIHDTILQHYADHYPEERSDFEYGYWIGLIKRTVRNASMILTVSNHAHRQILAFCDRYRITPPEIRVIYEGSDFETWVDEPPAVKRDAVVHLASVLPHKKTRLLLDWWRQFEEAGAALPELRLIGRLGPAEEQIARSLRRVHVMPLLPDEKYAAEIRHARALILPSEIEGFGLPALEAYYLGTPVCYVRGTSVEEVLDPSTTVGGFNLDDPASLRAALDQVLALAPDAIAATARHLRSRFSSQAFANAVTRAFEDVIR